MSAVSNPVAAASTTKVARGITYQDVRRSVTIDLLPKAQAYASAIDIACGTGAYSLALAERGYRVLAFDQDAQRITAARRDHAHAAVDYRVASLAVLHQLPAASRDLALALEIVEHLADPHELFAGVRRVLRPGGFLVMSTPNRWSLEAWGGTLRQLVTGDLWNGWDPTHRHLYRYGELSRLAHDHGFCFERTTGFHFGARSCGERLRRCTERRGGTLPLLPTHTTAWPLNRLGYKIAIRARRAD